MSVNCNLTASQQNMKKLPHSNFSHLSPVSLTSNIYFRLREFFVNIQNGSIKWFRGIGENYLRKKPKLKILCQTSFRPQHKVGRVLSFFSSRRNWDSPNHSPAGECALPPPPRFGGRGTLAGERGDGRVPIPTRDRHCGTLHIFKYFGGHNMCPRVLLHPSRHKKQ